MSTVVSIPLINACGKSTRNFAVDILDCCRGFYRNPVRAARKLHIA